MTKWVCTPMDKVYKDSANKSDAYKMGMWTAEYRLTPWSFGYIPDYNFLEAAQRKLEVNHPNYKQNVADFMQAVRDTKKAIDKSIYLSQPEPPNA